MYRRWFLICLPVILLLFTLPSLWQIDAQQLKADFRELEKAVMEELKETGTPGAAVAVISGNQIVFANAFTAANINSVMIIVRIITHRVNERSRIIPPRR